MISFSICILAAERIIKMQYSHVELPQTMELNSSISQPKSDMHAALSDRIQNLSIVLLQCIVVT